MSAMRIKDLENMMIGVPQRRAPIDIFRPDPVLCGCESRAKVYIQNEPHCWECAEDAGVKRV